MLTHHFPLCLSKILRPFLALWIVFKIIVRSPPAHTCNLLRSLLHDSLKEYFTLPSIRVINSILAYTVEMNTADRNPWEHEALNSVIDGDCGSLVAIMNDSCSAGPN